MFPADWARYVMKLATGAGKTKVMSLLMTWSYSHKLYETGLDALDNFLLIAPTSSCSTGCGPISRREDFPRRSALPPDGWDGQTGTAISSSRVHIQDEIGAVPETGNPFLTNIHRVYESCSAPSFDDADATDYFLGTKPATENDGQCCRSRCHHPRRQRARRSERRGASYSRSNAAPGTSRSKTSPCGCVRSVRTFPSNWT